MHALKQHASPHAILKTHFQDMHKLFAEAGIVRSAHWSQEDGVLRVYSGVPLLNMNGVIFSQYQQNINTSIQREIDFFKNKPIPGFVWYAEDYELELQKALLNKGFQSHGSTQVVLGSTNYTVPQVLPQNLQIRPVDSEAVLEDWMKVVGTVFNMPQKAQDAYKKMNFYLGFGEDAPIKRYIGYVNEKPAAVISVAVTSHLVSFLDGATLKEYRRRGFSGSLRMYALNEMRQRGYEQVASYLMCDAMALGVCQKLGLEKTWAYQAYFWTKSV
ncbi:MAG: hypothetical protein H6850_00650 [Alphaproteobacteria bacterium]|nr:MAG: hypothetical protein H6850_00650 [Alphaproteobacteria bacterium]